MGDAVIEGYINENKEDDFVAYGCSRTSLFNLVEV